jgi:hypothetical protein
MSITGTNASEFFIANASQAFNLAAGASHTLTVGFTPVSSGDKLATLNITSNDPDENPFQVGLRALRKAPVG